MLDILSTKDSSAFTVYPDDDKISIFTEDRSNNVVATAGATSTTRTSEL